MDTIQLYRNGAIPPPREVIERFIQELGIDTSYELLCEEYVPEPVFRIRFPTQSTRAAGADIEVTRKVLLLTRAEVAQRTGRSEQAVVRWEAGFNRPRGPAAHVIASMHEEASEVFGLEGLAAWREYLISEDPPDIPWPKLRKRSDNRPHIGTFLGSVLAADPKLHLADLAKTAGISVSGLKNYIYGHADPSDEVIEAVINGCELRTNLLSVLTTHSLLHPERRRPRFLAELEARRRGARIRAAREIIGVEQEMVGEHVIAGEQVLSKDAISAWEVGRNQPTSKATPGLEALERHARAIVGDRALEGFAEHIHHRMGQPRTVKAKRPRIPRP